VLQVLADYDARDSVVAVYYWKVAHLFKGVRGELELGREAR
jgi:hypothetical protein